MQAQGEHAQSTQKSPRLAGTVQQYSANRGKEIRCKHCKLSEEKRIVELIAVGEKEDNMECRFCK